MKPLFTFTPHLFLVVAAVLATACTRAPFSSTPLEADWRLESFQLEPNGPAHAPDGTPFTMSLGTDGSIHGRAACNTWRGKYRVVQTGTLDIDIGGVTRRRCLFDGPSPAETLYSFYLEALDRGGQFEVEGKTLVIRFTDETRWRFSRVGH